MIVVFFFADSRRCLLSSCSWLGRNLLRCASAASLRTPQVSQNHGCFGRDVRARGVTSSPSDGSSPTAPGRAPVSGLAHSCNTGLTASYRVLVNCSVIVLPLLSKMLDSRGMQPSLARVAAAFFSSVQLSGFSPVCFASLSVEGAIL